MKVTGCVGALLLIAVTASGQERSRPPWRWTLEQRLHDRFDAAKKKGRLAAALQANSIRRVGRGVTPIDGRVNPELFVPLELVDPLVDVTYDARTHEAYRPFITAAGWSYEEFWAALGTSFADYHALFQDVRERQKITRGHVTDTSEGRAAVVALCIARVHALDAARRQFGGDAFDAFLYTAIAPFRQVWTRETDTGDFIRFAKGECK